MSDSVEIIPGQIWKECDPRFERTVTVVSVAGDTVWIRSAARNGSTRTTKASRKRFNGKRGGYRYEGFDASFETR